MRLFLGHDTTLYSVPFNCAGLDEMGAVFGLEIQLVGLYFVD